MIGAQIAQMSQIAQFERERQIAMMEIRQQQALSGIGGLAGLGRSEPDVRFVSSKKHNSIKDELQDEVDEWLKDTI